jgi:hypothetical protein
MKGLLGMLDGRGQRNDAVSRRQRELRAQSLQPLPGVSFFDFLEMLRPDSDTYYARGTLVSDILERESSTPFELAHERLPR